MMFAFPIIITMLMKKLTHPLLSLVSMGICALLVGQSALATTTIKNALEDTRLGLYEPRSLLLSDGLCKDCSTIPQALWYFKKETLAVPGKDSVVSGFSRTDNAQDDVRQWIVQATPAALNVPSPLIWLGSSKLVEAAHINEAGNRIKTATGEEFEFGIIDKIPTNLSYYDDSSRRFFAQRPVRLRGELDAVTGNSQRFIARTIWPLDFAITQNAALQPFASGENFNQLVRAEHGGARSSFATRVLWERQPGAARTWQNKAIVGLMLNGAQGDDDEAHGGHFAVVTGRYDQSGDWSRWLVNNFYNLGSISEKGIIAAATPMDKYLMDLNNGQSYYRPSYMLVAVLKDGRVAEQYQAAIDRVYNHFYRRDFDYDHAKANCSGISVDTFRTLGWNIPNRGNEGAAKAIGAYAYVSATKGSLEDGRKIYDYMNEEKVRLYPAVAFEVMGADLLNLGQGQTQRSLSPLEKNLSADIEALIYVRIPQIPSSRAFGLAPVFSFDEYLKQAPEDRSKWKIVATDPRPFPPELRDGLALKHETAALIPLPVAFAFASILALLTALVAFIRGKFRKAKRKS